MKLYGLFEMTYDYHEWETLECVSRDEDLLRKYASTVDPDLPVVNTQSENEAYCRQETTHYYIKEVDVI